MFRESDFKFIQPPDSAMVKANYDISFEADELGATIEISLQCGEIYSYRKGEDCIYTVWNSDSVTLHITEEYFDILYHKVDLGKLPKNMQYYSYNGFYGDLYDGMTVWVHDFESENICKTAVFYEEEDLEIGMTEQYVLKMIFVAEEEDGNIKCAIASKNVVYFLDDYGSKWAALKEQA